MIHETTLEGRLLTEKEALEYLQVTRATLWRWVRAGKIDRYKAGQLNRYDPVDLDLFLKFKATKEKRRFDDE